MGKELYRIPSYQVTDGGNEFLHTTGSTQTTESKRLGNFGRLVVAYLAGNGSDGYLLCDYATLRLYDFGIDPVTRGSFDSNTYVSICNTYHLRRYCNILYES